MKLRRLQHILKVVYCDSTSLKLTLVRELMLVKNDSEYLCDSNEDDIYWI